MNSAVGRAIRYIWEHYNEPLSLSDIADSAILSRFHFSRVFRAETGVTPGRFLSAVRIYQAKRMLLNSPMNITDISFAVGYNSLGSFTNHFTDSVGVSPGRFRRTAQNGGFEPPIAMPRASGRYGMVAGAVRVPADFAGAHVYIGTFDTPIVQRTPSCAVIAEIRSGHQAPYRLEFVPEGVWFLHAVAVADTVDPDPWTRRTLLLGRRDRVTVSAGVGTLAELTLRPRRPTDLPVLLALPDLEAELDLLAEPMVEPVSATGIAGTAEQR